MAGRAGAVGLPYGMHQARLERQGGAAGQRMRSFENLCQRMFIVRRLEVGQCIGQLHELTRGRPGIGFAKPGVLTELCDQTQQTTRARIDRSIAQPPGGKHGRREQARHEQCPARIRTQRGPQSGRVDHRRQQHIAIGQGLAVAFDEQLREPAVELRGVGQPEHFDTRRLHACHHTWLRV
jgi:hypothetical protein